MELYGLFATMDPLAANTDYVLQILPQFQAGSTDPDTDTFAVGGNGLFAEKNISNAPIESPEWNTVPDRTLTTALPRNWSKLLQTKGEMHKHRPVYQVWDLSTN